MKATVYGDLLWDIFPDVRVIGGAAYNFSAHLAALGNDVSLISAIGFDELGDMTFDMVDAHGVDKRFIKKNEYQTGNVVVSLDDYGNPSYVLSSNSAYDHIALDDEMLEAVKASEIFYFNTMGQRSEESRSSLGKILRDHGKAKLFCDVNLRDGGFDRECLRICLENAEILKVSDEEGHFIYDMGLVDDNEKYLPRAVVNKYPNIQLVLYTLGANGSEVLDAKSGTVYSSGMPEPVEVVSTVGAGDCYGATFLNAYMSGCSIPDSIRAATERSRLVVAHKEAVPDLR